MSLTAGVAPPLVVLQVVGKIAAIEVPRNEWPELVPALCDSITKPQAGDPNLVLNLRLASLEALGFTCEELVNQNLQSHLSAASNHILTALIYGMRAEEPPQVRQAGVTALYNAMRICTLNQGDAVFERGDLGTQMYVKNKPRFFKIRKSRKPAFLNLLNSK